MNQKGWGLKDFMIILGVILIALIITAGVYRKGFMELFGTTNEPIIESQTNVIEKDTYQDLERKLQRAAERYQNDNYQGDYNSIETWVLKYDLLKEKRYLKEKITDINDRNTECTGYVKFEKNETHINYYPYLRCGNNYRTEGYDETYEN